MLSIHIEREKWEAVVFSSSPSIQSTSCASVVKVELQCKYKQTKVVPWAKWKGPYLSDRTSARRIGQVLFSLTKKSLG